jgi:hypothetical protein
MEKDFLWGLVVLVSTNCVILYVKDILISIK